MTLTPDDAHVDRALQCVRDATSASSSYEHFSCLVDAFAAVGMALEARRGDAPDDVQYALGVALMTTRALHAAATDALDPRPGT